MTTVIDRTWPERGMPLWLFLFTKPDRKLVSARVVAPTKVEAAQLLGDMIGETAMKCLLSGARAIGEGVIVSCLGALDTQAPRIVRAERPDGAVWQ